MFYFPSIGTIKEYDNLKNTQKPIKISKEITKMDRFVCDKYSGLKDIGFLGSNIALLGICLKNHPQIPLKRSLIGLAGFFAMTLLAVFHADKKRNEYLSNPRAKQRKYIKQGLNAVI